MMKCNTAYILKAATLAVFLLSGAMSSLAEKTAAGNWDLGLAVGVGERSNPLINSDDIRQYWIADIAYYSDHWFFDNGDLGLVLVGNERFLLNTILSVNSDRVYFSHLNDNFFSAGGPNGALPDDKKKDVEPPDRDYALELGLELIIDRDWGVFQSQLNGDVSNKHKGIEIWADYSYDFLFSRWLVQPSIGLSWRNDKLNNYYYGVEEDEASNWLPEYEAESGFNRFAKLSVTYIFSRQWRWVNSLQYERINSEAANSPIMTDDKVTTVFTGIYYAIK